jgi:ABC-2 type transport system permease protein
MIRIWAVMKRDLLRIIRNPFTLFASVVLPLVYLLILGNSLQGPIKGLTLGLVALDDGPEARNMVGALQAIERGPKTIQLVSIEDPERGMRALRGGEVEALLVIPERFSRNLERGLEAKAGLYLDNVDQVAAGAIVAALEGSMPAIRAPLERFELHRGPARIRDEEIYPKVDYDASLIPGVVVLSIFMGSMITGAFNLVMDRFLGVHEAYLSTPLRRSDINLGVLLSGTIVTLASSGLVLISGLLITGASVHGGVLGVLAMMGVVVLTALGMLAMMMVLLGRATHPRITGTITGFLNIILFFPSGALYPVQSFPGWLRAFARVNPETHAVAALKDLMFRGGDLGAAGGHVMFLAGFTTVMLLLSTLTLKRTL